MKGLVVKNLPQAWSFDPDGAAGALDASLATGKSWRTSSRSFLRDLARFYFPQLI